MVKTTDHAISNNSDVEALSSNLTDVLEHVELRSNRLQPGEVVILIIVVVLWVCALVLFIKRWENIRLTEPQGTRYKNSPKNLHTIKIVKRSQDSVIYKNYSRKMSVTMVEREKKLLRMNTVPIMKNVASLQPLNTFKKLATTGMVEDIKEENEIIDDDISIV